MEKNKIDGLGFFGRLVASTLFSALKTVVGQIKDPDVRNPVSNLLEQLEQVVQLLSDSDKDNAAQVKAWAQIHGTDTAQNLGFLILQLLKAKGIEVPQMVTDWLRVLTK